MPLIDVPTVHAVTDPRILADPAFKFRAEAVFRALGPAGAVHLRGPGVSARHIYSLAVDLAPLQEVTGCRLVINDRIDLARAAGAWGAQLGERSLRVGHAMPIRGRLALGASVHAAAEAVYAQGHGAAWVLAGNVYATPTHPGTDGLGESFIGDVVATGARVIAIGGILPSHVPHLKSLGAHGVAAIRGIWLAEDSGNAAAQYLSPHA